MLDAYRRGLSGPEVFRQALDVEPEAFDKEFDGWFQERFGSALEAVAGDGGGAFHRELQRALASLAAGDPGAAVVAFERAKGLFPEYAERDNPYWHLAKIHREAGRLREAALQLASLTALAESDYAANVEEAEVLEELGDLAGAASALERAVYIDPRDPALHERLAARYGDQERWREAARERQAVLALNPVDKAEAYFQLALAWFQAGERVAARSAVLRALDIAPAFAQAQELLLQIRGIPPQGGLER
jgi:tetratricopeptide (TPR) repeat protein